jgi:hypothetical protein
MPIRYIDQIKDLKDKKVFIRVDFNVPQDDKGCITEDTRIAGAVATIRYAVEQGAKVVLPIWGAPRARRKPSTPWPRLPSAWVNFWVGRSSRRPIVSGRMSPQ